MSNNEKNQDFEPSVLAALQEALVPQSPPAKLRGRILERIHSAPGAKGLLTVRENDGRWRELFTGLEYKILAYDERGGTKSFLLHAQPGVHMPAHGHNGLEECLVLDGEFYLGDLKLSAGDFHAAGMEALHEEAHTETGVTVYLRASILDYAGIEP